MMRPIIVVALLTLVPQARPVLPPSENFVAAKGLYASGAYEEALSRLSSAPVDDTAEAHQYRALCLLALGRMSEVQSSLESIVNRAPFFRMTEEEVSPRLVTMFRDVRKRQLPSAAKALYAAGKASFDEKAYSRAASQLKDLITLFGDEDLADEAATLADVKMLAEGFLKLADMELTAIAAAEAAAAAAAAAPPVVAGARIYSDVDKDVRPPVEISQTLPAWTPPPGVSDLQEFRGALRVLIDEQGRVESASIVQSIAPTYDPALLTATKSWKFQPAQRNGEAVKYHKVIGVVLRGR